MDKDASAGPSGDLPPFDTASDEDGGRYIIIDPADPADADMSGWTAESSDREDPTGLSRFEQDTWYSTGEGRWNGLGYGAPKTAWCALTEHGEWISALIGPDGTRLEP